MILLFQKTPNMRCAATQILAYNYMLSCQDFHHGSLEVSTTIKVCVLNIEGGIPIPSLFRPFPLKEFQALFVCCYDHCFSCFLIEKTIQHPVGLNIRIC